MEVQYLRYFREVATHGSFTLAARALGITQPALSKMVRLIEQEYGVRLFERHRKGVTLTRVGRDLLAHSQVIFEEYEQATNLLAAKSAFLSGHLKLGASDTLCHHVLPDLLTTFCDQYPGIDITLRSGQSGDLFPELISGELDAGLFFNKPSAGSLQVQRLKWVEFSLVVAGSVKLPKNDVISFLNKNLRYIGPIVANPQATVQPLYKQIGLIPRHFIETNHQESPKELVRRNLGYTILPKYSVAREIQDKQLQEVSIGKPIGLYLHLVSRSQRCSRLLELFKRFVKSNLT